VGRIGPAWVVILKKRAGKVDEIVQNWDQGGNAAAGGTFRPMCDNAAPGYTSPAGRVKPA